MKYVQGILLMSSFVCCCSQPCYKTQIKKKLLMAIIKPKGILYKHQLVFLGEEIHLAEHFASHEAGQNTVKKQRNFMSPSIQRDCFF